MQGKENNPLYSAAMDLIVRANWSVYKEGKAEGKTEGQQPGAVSAGDGSTGEKSGRVKNA